MIKLVALIFISAFVSSSHAADCETNAASCSGSALMNYMTCTNLGGDSMYCSRIYHQDLQRCERENEFCEAQSRPYPGETPECHPDSYCRSND